MTKYPQMFNSNVKLSLEEIQQKNNWVNTLKINKRPPFMEQFWECFQLIQSDNKSPWNYFCHDGIDDEIPLYSWLIFKVWYGVFNCHNDTFIYKLMFTIATNQLRWQHIRTTPFTPTKLTNQERSY